MSDAAQSRPYSPCNNNCAFDDQRGYCRGCHRTLDEIMHWRTMSPERRQQIWDRIEAARREEQQAMRDRALGNG